MQELDGSERLPKLDRESADIGGTVEHLRNNPGTAELTLHNEATAALERVSAPQSYAYPYGTFDADQRARWLQDGTSDLKPPDAREARL